VSHRFFKKRYLVRNPQEVIALFAIASSSIKKNITSFYCEDIRQRTHPLGVIAFAFSSHKEALVCEAALVEYIVSDVSEDKRYKRRSLGLFGLPQRYDFELDEVFERLDRLGERTLELSFYGGMSTQKVLKVLLYQAFIGLEHVTKDFLESLPNTFLEFQKSIQHVLAIIKLWKYVFDASTLMRMQERWEILDNIVHEEEIQTIKALIKTNSYRLLLLDVSYLLFEESDFYATKDMPILFFVRKHLKRNPTKLLKKLKKSLYM